MPRINTPEAFKAARKQLGLTQSGLADLMRLGKDGRRLIRRYEHGERAISGPMQVALECILYGDPQPED